MAKAGTFEEILAHSNESGKRFFEIAQEQEAQYAECAVSDVRKRVKTTLQAMKDAIKEGLKSSELSSSTMVGSDCSKLKKHCESGQGKKNGIFSTQNHNIMMYALATAEQNARMGKIAACPTAGACGIVPAAIVGISESQKLNEEKQIDALLTAGLIGKTVAAKVALAGAVAGCQAECGVAAGMAAGAVVELLGGNSRQVANAAALALKNILGLVCDPIAGLVEVPCVKRNSFLAIHAVTAAEMALAGIESVVPLDEVVDALKQVGALMSSSLKESAQAGLATTPTGLRITEKLNELWAK